MSRAADSMAALNMVEAAGSAGGRDWTGRRGLRGRHWAGRVPLGVAGGVRSGTVAGGGTGGTRKRPRRTDAGRWSRGGERGAEVDASRYRAGQAGQARRGEARPGRQASKQAGEVRQGACVLYVDGTWTGPALTSEWRMDEAVGRGRVARVSTRPGTTKVRWANGFLGLTVGPKECHTHKTRQQISHMAAAARLGHGQTGRRHRRRSARAEACAERQSRSTTHVIIISVDELGFRRRPCGAVARPSCHKAKGGYTSGSTVHAVMYARRTAGPRSLQPVVVLV